ncbi:7SK snRNA methylphosphate capping enzyme [Paramormyrops kingsleyae]|uniref:RNA methyltransferase n=2 Tax=Paramormyrops kingsleyae TaxID=1676925 RepID=A0A3B3RW34_9TELE|nr:7SK snRNA methylphosphate capping enzyme-like [Paramormyrops kingsleyae]XP_023659373.1 7SK snRNA methylphosphate capping enzyme-like [Paramormyrops kingsleyae]XP_023659374.1 7SK snRNA methylphosphate capping enzyme-like [Paramormyrops kingsleyae]XP_023659375.1 7SK snRNA methylphosphate capping enzyme-like [Paramormyrops kingsleyae]XP_023659377.1 7SK snRNA methylphosphate capping enzyme-like [Paramormyrops kingsleyae]
MIEMSVDKETVLPGDVRVDPAAHLQPQQGTERDDRCAQGPTVAEADMATSGNSDSASTCAVVALTGSGILMESDSTNSCGHAERVELEAKMAGSPFKPRNGLQQAEPQRPPQPPKLNKRRNTMNVGFKHPGVGKRRRRANSESDPVLPTNFLLGGNIFDPLNLNSLLDEEVNRAINAETPKSSPLPAKSRDPVEILIPRDITDPLNLNSTGGDAGILASPIKSGGRKRHRNRHHGGGGNAATSAHPEPSELESTKSSERCTVATAGGASAAEGVVLEAPREGAVLLSSMPLLESPRPYELNTVINCRDTVVPPILPRGTASCGPETAKLAAPPSQQLSSRQRKRRRASSKCESRPAAVTPNSSAKKGGSEKGRRPGQGAPQTFHTPCTSTGGGRSGPAPSQSHRKPRQQQKFQYGNYNKYYGYRNPGWSEDPRMCVLQPEWFQGKAVLDLGCNTGHLTLAIAKNWRPARIVGLDIDSALVHAARQNIRHYLSEVQAQQARRAVREDAGGSHGDSTGRRDALPESPSGGAANNVQKMDRPDKSDKKTEAGLDVMWVPDGSTKLAEPPVSVERGDTGAVCSEDMEGVEGTMEPEPPRNSPMDVDHPFPVSLKISRGPIAAPPLPDTPPAVPGDFPANISFVRGNYVLDNDILLHAQKPEYDVILCLSVTKWVHLNWGDSGVQRLFHRVFRHLRPGGLFILEPQPWGSYGKRKKLTDAIFKNYHSIRFKPDQFSTYLTSEVGFSSYELIGTPKSSSRGFQRPIYLFRKGPSPPRK